MQTELSYLDHKVALGVSGHFGEFKDQLAEFGATLCIYHPAWTRNEGENATIRTLTEVIKVALLKESPVVSF